MTFLSPLALALSALAVPLLLLYFLKVRRRQMTVSSLLLWDPALRDREASTFFQRLQRDPLLILQILALLALTAALARPAMTVMGHGAKRVAIVLDTSASMKATDVELVALRPGPAPGARAAGPARRGRRGDGDRGRASSRVWSSRSRESTRTSPRPSGACRRRTCRTSSVRPSAPPAPWWARTRAPRSTSSPTGCTPPPPEPLRATTSGSAGSAWAAGRTTSASPASRSGATTLAPTTRRRSSRWPTSPPSRRRSRTR